MAKKNKIKHVLKANDITILPGLIMAGIQTGQKIYKLAFDFNRILGWDLQLQPDIEIIRNGKKILFNNYATSENPNGQKIRLIENKRLIPLPHPNSLFDTHETFYLFRKLKSSVYVLILPEEENLDVDNLQHNFKPGYPLKFIDLNIADFLSDFPVFPV